jgi:hypothetical protein
MHDAVTHVQEKVQTFVEALVAQNVVGHLTGEGEPVLELYSLLDALAPDVVETAGRLNHVRFVLTQQVELGLYLVCIPLPDVLIHLLPCSTLPEAQAFQHWLSEQLWPAFREDTGHKNTPRPCTSPGNQTTDPLQVQERWQAFLYELFAQLAITL